MSIYSFLKIIRVFFLIAIIIGVYFLTDFLYFINHPISSAKYSFQYNFPKGASLKTLSHDLYQQRYLKKPAYLVILGYLKGASRHLKAGEYQFVARITPIQLLQQLIDGNTLQHELTLIEGWQFSDVLNAIENNPYLKHSLSGQSLKSVMEKLDSDKLNLEGLFFPDTYHFPKHTLDIDFLKRAYQVMQTKLAKYWIERAPNLPYRSSYDALIVASLIEKETALANERPLVAGIIVKRLKKKIPLQIDPTIIYGLNKYHAGPLSKRDLQTPSPYNTYLNRGLPPTPIALPSDASLLAALHPAETDYWYFVAKGDGSHHFSKTLAEQNHAIRQYIK